MERGTEPESSAQAPGGAPEASSPPRIELEPPSPAPRVVGGWQDPGESPGGEPAATAGSSQLDQVLDEILGSEGAEDLWSEDLPSSDPVERRNATLALVAAIVAIVTIAGVVAIVPGHHRRQAMRERYADLLTQIAATRHDLAQGRLELRRIKERDLYYITRLAEDRLQLTSPESQQLPTGR